MPYSETPAAEASGVDLGVTVAGIKLRNPVLTASGTFGYGEEYAQIFDISRLGGIIVKAISLKPRNGNPPPRLVEASAGCLSACGLQNIGVHRFVDEKMPFLRQIGIPVIVNLAGESIAEFVEIVRVLSQVDGIAGVELNVSCPNVKHHGMAFGIDPVAVHDIVSAVKAEAPWPVICKLTPNVTDIAVIARSAEDAGADAISLINAPLGMAIDVHKRRPRIANVTGGLTGPAIKPIALRMVWQVANAVEIPVIGIGGISNWEDAAEFLIAGACAVEIGTAFFSNPFVAVEVIDGLGTYLQSAGFTCVGDLIGSLVC
jgi:dihydroorotate dehydrogenase (NAD+) catalytic subunit